MPRLPELEITNMLVDAALQVEVGERYYHYKNPERQYKVLEFAFQVGNSKVCVIYQALYGSRCIFSRELDSWLSQVQVDGASVARFTRVQ